MKTPRQILLDRHQAASPRLDRLRVDAISNELFEQPVTLKKQTALSSFGFAALWSELFIPYRKAWMGLGVIWVFLLGVRFATPQEEAAPSGSGGPSAVAALQQIRQTVAKVSEPQPAPPPDAPAHPPEACLLRVTTTRRA